MSRGESFNELVRAYKLASRGVAEAHVYLNEAEERVIREQSQFDIVKKRIEANQCEANKPRSRRGRNRSVSHCNKHVYAKELARRQRHKELVERLRMFRRRIKNAERHYRLQLRALYEAERHLATAAAHIGRHATIAERYLASLEIVLRIDVVHIYFGGIGSPDGEHHGHYALNFDTGKLTYRRDPFKPHGGHNYVPTRELAS